MVFIDGGYLREILKDFCETDIFKVQKLRDGIVNSFNNMVEHEVAYPFKANLIRIYYYDAIVNEGEPEFIDQKKYFNELSCQFLTIRLGELVKSCNKKRARISS